MYIFVKLLFLFIYNKQTVMDHLFLSYAEYVIKSLDFFISQGYFLLSKIEN